MAYRIQVSFHKNDAGTTPAALLHANNPHEDIDLDELVQKTVRDEKLPSRILAALLSATYPQNGRGGKGDPIFRLDFGPADAEKRLAILFPSIGECVLVKAPVLAGSVPSRLVTLLNNYGKAKFGDEWWPGNPGAHLPEQEAGELEAFCARGFDAGTLSP